MKLPNASAAFVDIAKLRDYSLSQTHGEGKNKARVFQAALDINASDAEWLRDQLLDAVLWKDCLCGPLSSFGQRYSVDCTLYHASRSAIIRSAWIIRAGEISLV